MSKSENAKKPRDKKKPSAKEKLAEAIASCEASHQHWKEIYENGCSDPFWPDGVNLNLVRNHIYYYNDIIKTCCDALGRDYPEVYRKDIPAEVSPDYIAKPEAIVRDAKQALEKLTSNPAYLELLKIKSKFGPKQLESICYSAVVGYVTRLKTSLENNDYVGMRLYRNYERYIELFERCLENAEKLKPESFQLSLFDVMTA